MSWQSEYEAMRAILKRWGESDADADADARRWADMVEFVNTTNDTTMDDENQYC